MVVNFVCFGVLCFWNLSGNIVMSMMNNLMFMSVFGQVQVMILGFVDCVVMDYVGLGIGINNQFVGWGLFVFDCSVMLIFGFGFEIMEKFDGVVVCIIVEWIEGVIVFDL